MPITIIRQPNLFALKRLDKPTDVPIDLQIQAAKLPAPIEEYPFATSIGRNWKADRAWPEYRILFEIEGGGFGQAIHVGTGAWTTRRVKGQKIRVEIAPGEIVRVGGRHNTGEGMRNDCEKYSQAAIMGWLVIRATPEQIRDGSALTWLEAAFAHRRSEGFPR